MNKASKQICQQKKSPIDINYIFNQDAANKYGLKESIFIKHLEYSISHHKKKNTHFYEGRYWAYNSISSLESIYTFWTPRIIKGIIKSLKDQNVIITGNFNKSKYDRTTWFSFTDK